jgi:hypothetical protein
VVKAWQPHAEMKWSITDGIVRGKCMETLGRSRVFEAKWVSGQMEPRRDIVWCGVVSSGVVESIRDGMFGTPGVWFSGTSRRGSGWGRRHAALGTKMWEWEWEWDTVLLPSCKLDGDVGVGWAASRE